MAKGNLTPEFAEWLVSSRYETTFTGARLYRLLTTYPDRLANADIAEEAHTLVAVSFSLWWSAFLADKNDQPLSTSLGAINFLADMIQTNTIAFSQDRGHKDWTFNYYASNARYRLSYLFQERWGAGKDWAPLLAEVDGARAGAGRSAKDRWKTLQMAFDAAVFYFENFLSSQKTKAE